MIISKKVFSFSFRRNEGDVWNVVFWFTWRWSSSLCFSLDPLQTSLSFRASITWFCFSKFCRDWPLALAFLCVFFPPINLNSLVSSMLTCLFPELQLKHDFSFFFLQICVFVRPSVWLTFFLSLPDVRILAHPSWFPSPFPFFFFFPEWSLLRLTELVSCLFVPGLWLSCFLYSDRKTS